MASVRELIEAGQPPRENERVLVVMDETTEAELELSFYDHQQGRFIGPDGLTSEPHFFRATVARIGEKRGYLLGPEVTRCLRLRALIGIASRQGPLGDVPSDVRTYRRMEHGATIDIPVNRVESSKDLKPGGGNWRGVGGDAASDAGSGAAALGAGGAIGSQPQRPKIHPKREPQHWRRFAVTAGLLIIPLIVAAAFALARLGWYSLVISVNGSLDFVQNAQQSDSEPAVFTPESTSIEIRRALWARPFEGWWISKSPPVQIEFDKDEYWLNTHHESSDDHAIVVVLRPNGTAESTAAIVLRTQLIFRNTDTGRVFDTREATLRLVGAGQLHIADADALVFTGFKGGPFNPESAQISLSASGRDVRWSAQNIPSWIELTGGPTGKLNKGSSVTLTVTPRAANLAPGPYDARLTFRNDDVNTVTEKPIRVIVLDAALECDRRTASRFDPDRPAAAPFVADTSTLSEADQDQAMRACAAAFLGDSSSGASRRFIAEMGRAYAARAVRLARSGDEAGAHAAMTDAVRLWREAATKGSTAAMNFLGSYWAGLYDGAVDPSASNKCRSEPPRFSFTATDMTMARDYWERAARANPPNAEAMSNYGGLLLTAPDLCPPRPDLQNMSEGISWLKQAVDRGNLGAAEVLGEVFYRGRAPSSSAPNDSFPKNVDEGLRWLAMACKDGDVRAKDFVSRMISTTKEMNAAKRPPGC
jgi:TPR repeat protein